MAAERLRVDPIDLHLSSDHLDVHHAEFQAAHASADSDIEAAQRGWVGTSAAALQAKFVEWQAVTAQLSSDVEAHGSAFRAAARGYTTTDTDNAGSLDAQI
ncbi:MAG: WXG100 family type VII secretion target [Actinomycetia bacterium]|nr:WXG100 family type VII secretion target [Actinomycetes bacterium]